MLPEQSS